MAGTDLRAGTGTQPDKVLTTDGDGHVGNGEGNYVDLITSNIILSTPNQSNFSPIDLNNYCAGYQSIWELHCRAINISADKLTYERFIYNPDLKKTTKIDVLDGGNYIFIIDSNGVLSSSGGGNRKFSVRIERLM